MSDAPHDTVCPICSRTTGRIVDEPVGADYVSFQCPDCGCQWNATVKRESALDLFSQDSVPPEAKPGKSRSQS